MIMMMMASTVILTAMTFGRCIPRSPERITAQHEVRKSIESNERIWIDGCDFVVVKAQVPQSGTETGERRRVDCGQSILPDFEPRKRSESLERSGFDFCQSVVGKVEVLQAIGDAAERTCSETEYPIAAQV